MTAALELQRRAFGYPKHIKLRCDTASKFVWSWLCLYVVFANGIAPVVPRRTKYTIVNISNDCSVLTAPSLVNFAILIHLVRTLNNKTILRCIPPYKRNTRGYTFVRTSCEMLMTNIMTVNFWHLYTYSILQYSHKIV